MFLCHIDSSFCHTICFAVADAKSLSRQRENIVLIRNMADFYAAQQGFLSKY